MSDPQFGVLIAQIQSLSAQIQTESNQRSIADEALASRIAASETAIAAVNLQAVAEAGNAAGDGRI